MDMLADPQYKTKDGAALRIWRDAAPNRYLSEQLGRTLYDEVIYCEIITPGSRDSTPVFELERTFCPEMNHPAPKVSVKYTELREYVEDFKKNEEIDTSLAGTPLTQWPEMNRSLVATLRAQGLYTVDALAGLPDSKLIVVGPDGRTWREKARAYIESAKGSAYATELAARVQSLEATLVASQDRETLLAARIAELETANGGGATATSTAKATKSTKAEGTPTTPPTPVAAGGETLVPAGEPKTDMPII